MGLFLVNEVPFYVIIQLVRQYQKTSYICAHLSRDGKIINNQGREPSKIKKMSVKIRLQRHGKKGKPFYWIVAADARAKRDGRYLEKLGTYNPNTNPATVNLDIDGAVKWLQDGAQPTDTAKTILSYKGAMLKNHLVGGVRKGALTEEQAEEKFQAWLEEKAGKVASKEENVAKVKTEAKAKALEAEKAVNEARVAAAVEAAAPEEVAEEAAPEVVAEEVAEEAAPEVVAEEVAPEEAAPEVVAEEAAPEVVAEEATPEVVVRKLPKRKKRNLLNKQNFYRYA